VEAPGQLPSLPPPRKSGPVSACGILKQKETEVQAAKTSQYNGQSTHLHQQQCIAGSFVN